MFPLPPLFTLDAERVAKTRVFRLGKCNLVAVLASAADHVEASGESFEDGPVSQPNPAPETTTVEPVLTQAKPQSTQEMPTLTAEQCVRPKKHPKAEPPKSVTVSQETHQMEETPEDIVIEVSGIPRGSHRDMVRLFFSSARTGGGEIKDLQYSSDDGTARITYMHSKGVYNILYIHGMSLLSTISRVFTLG